MDITKQPGIWFDNILLKELNFSRKQEIASYDIDIKFLFTRSFACEKKTINCELSCDVSDKKDTFHLYCCMIGMFSYIHGQENLDLERFADTNAPAIILPYIREVVSTTTVQAGLPPIRIPPVNILAILKNNNGKLSNIIDLK